MSKEMQIEEQAIEEMRELIHAEIKKAVDSGLITWTEFADYLANALYNAGYRKQEWISVEERLPPKNEMVLIFCGGARELDWICSTGLWYDHDYTLVTHWMPLPEPPKMKGD